MIQLYFIFIVEILETLWDKLRSIVDNELLQYVKSGDDIIHDEVHQNVGLNDRVRSISTHFVK